MVETFPAASLFSANKASLTRRRLLTGGAAVLSGPAAAANRPELHRDHDDWRSFCARCLHDDGRIIDTGNRGVSHSEGQGTGLLFAARFDDRAAFERILAWTAATLRRPDDRLHAWRYRPGAAMPVDDPNNATDGDLLIAWGLALAHRRWGKAEHRALARAIATDVLRRCTENMGRGRVLLPGAFGFSHPRHVVVNLSYWLFGALGTMEDLVPNPAWGALRDAGLMLAQEARFGRWGLPPDWLSVPRDGSSPRPAEPWPARFSWDAVRVPLHLVWGGHVWEPTVRAAAAFWADAQRAVRPAWVDLSNNSVANYAAPPGIEAIAHLVVTAQVGTGRYLGMPRVADANDYYGAKLIMMAHFAWEDRGFPLAGPPAGKGGAQTPDSGATVVRGRNGMLPGVMYR